jgi:cytochrome c
MQQDMQSASKLEPLSRRFGLLALAVLYLLVCRGASAQNLDEGKSAVRLFADSCVTCHHSPRGLAKGRYRVTLFMFLQDHYSANSRTAWELASYLSSLDTPQRGKSRTAAANSSAAASATRKSSNRPPMPVQ